VLRPELASALQVVVDHFVEEDVVLHIDRVRGDLRSSVRTLYPARPLGEHSLTPVSVANQSTL
jgi:hypothetical protein